MKKILLCTGAAALMLGAASCSSEIDEPGITGDGNVHFTVKLPEQMRTRAAISDGTTASTLTYAVYDKATDELVTLSEDQVSFDPATLTATVDLKLVNGKSYELLFWADAPGNTFYEFKPESKSIKVDYTGLTNSDESRDAFFASRVFDVTGPINETVELRRPFAQVNLGTDDMNTDAVKKAYSKGLGVSLSTTAYGTLNLSDGTVDDEQPVTFANAAATVTSGESFPYNPNPGEANPYTWISMDYILTSSAKDVIDATFTFYDGTVANAQALPVSNVPVQRNYRTNIYGSLLTSPANLQVIIKPAYEEDDYNVHVAASVSQLVELLSDPTVSELTVPEGTTLDLTDYNNSNDRLVISSDKTITLNGTVVSDKSGFKIDNGATVTIIGGEFQSTGDDALGMFRVWNGSTLNVKNAKIKHNTNKNGVPFGPVGSAFINLDNVTVDSDFGAIQSWSSYKGARVTATNCTFLGRSTNEPGIWTYNVNMIGEDNEAVLNNCTVVGVQGAVAAVHGAKVTLNGGFFGTFVPESGKPVAFYPLYTSNAGEGSQVIVNGEAMFYSDNTFNRGIFLDGTDAQKTLVMGAGAWVNRTPTVSGGDAWIPAAGLGFVDKTKTVTVTNPWGKQVSVTLTQQLTAQ